MVAQKLDTNSSQNWDSCIEIEESWSKEVWTFNYSRRYLPGGIKAIDWEVLTPEGEVRYTTIGEKKPDVKLAQRCLDEEGRISEQWLYYEFKLLVSHYASQFDREEWKEQRQKRTKKPRQLSPAPRSNKKEP